MTISTKKPLYAEVHNVPDNYEFTDEELNRIIAGDMFTPRQDAIMAREIQKLRAAMLQGSQPVSQNYKLNKLSGNSPVTPDGWISCSERMPAQDDWILIYSKHGEYMAGQVQGEYVELSDGTLSWLGNALYWMPLPEPPKEAK